MFAPKYLSPQRTEDDPDIQIGRVNPTLPDTVDFIISVFLGVHGFYYRTQRTVEVIEVVELTEVGGFFNLNHEPTTMDFIILNY